MALAVILFILSPLSMCVSCDQKKTIYLIRVLLLFIVFVFLF